MEVRPAALSVCAATVPRSTLVQSHRAHNDLLPEELEGMVRAAHTLLEEAAAASAGKQTKGGSRAKLRR